MLDLTPFRKAIAQLELALNERQRQPQNDFIRDSVIQRFEFTYELSHKMLIRYLTESEPEGDLMKKIEFSNLVRRGSERGLLLNGWDKWHTYRDARNRTSHGYDEAKANAVAEIIPDFYNDARFLLDSIAERLNA